MASTLQASLMLGSLPAVVPVLKPLLAMLFVRSARMGAAKRPLVLKKDHLTTGRCIPVIRLGLTYGT
ncbi:MAG TPA: hypothetical protein PKE27_15025 [Povalibacter sp.]|uniref:hypothetical protein n=1 Tax=Povalibacter sp. TaxID=1962978 RepID=UPI002BE71423|nr:hypothetical protein [Povalibacter sp.]HMN45889.1 hypothetical protein [Povalibacter sp.]